MVVKQNSKCLQEEKLNYGNKLYYTLRESLSKTGPVRFGSENQFPLNFAHECMLA